MDDLVSIPHDDNENLGDSLPMKLGILPLIATESVTVTESTVSD